MYLANDLYYSDLKKIFIDSNVRIIINSDHVVVEDSKNQTEEIIIQIVESVGFCPFISENKIGKKFAFTIVPYKLPKSFKKIHDASISTILAIPSGKISEESQDEYFSFDEVCDLIEASKFVRNEKAGTIEDRWVVANNHRTSVLSALEQALVEIISPCIKDGYPIIEIGSGIGYNLNSDWSKQLVKTQPSLADCTLLNEKATDPVYQLDIEGIYNALIQSGKKIPLFFALSVFDVIPSDNRKASLSQLSQLQNSGDRIVMIHDIHPHFEETLNQLEIVYPEHTIFPARPGNIMDKFSVLMVPTKDAPCTFSKGEISWMFKCEADGNMTENLKKLRKELDRLQTENKAKVIAFEEFYIEQITKELEQNGYKAKIYYHNSFTIGDNPKDAFERDDLAYSNRGTATKCWPLKNLLVINSLRIVGIPIPEYVDEAFVHNLRKKKQKIFCSELLVVEATKI